MPEIVFCKNNQERGSDWRLFGGYDEEQDGFPTETDDKGPNSGITLKWGSGILDNEVFGLKACGSDNRNIEMARSFISKTKFIDNISSLISYRLLSVKALQTIYSDKNLQNYKERIYDNESLIENNAKNYLRYIQKSIITFFPL